MAARKKKAAQKRGDSTLSMAAQRQKAAQAAMREGGVPLKGATDSQMRANLAASEVAVVLKKHGAQIRPVMGPPRMVRTPTGSYLIEIAQPTVEVWVPDEEPEGNNGEIATP